VLNPPTGPAGMAPLPMTARCEVRQAPDGDTAVALVLGCGAVTCEFLLSPDDAADFGKGLGDALEQVALRAQSARKPRLAVPPPSLLQPAPGSNRSPRR
jgi:hypothetical protein